MNVYRTQLESTKAGEWGRTRGSSMAHAACKVAAAAGGGRRTVWVAAPGSAWHPGDRAPICVHRFVLIVNPPSPPASATLRPSGELESWGTPAPLQEGGA